MPLLRVAFVFVADPTHTVGQLTAELDGLLAGSKFQPIGGLDFSLAAVEPESIHRRAARRGDAFEEQAAREEKRHG